MVECQTIPVKVATVRFSAGRSVAWVKTILCQDENIPALIPEQPGGSYVVS